MRQTLPPDLGGQNRINPHYGGAYGLMWRFYRQPETIASLFEGPKATLELYHQGAFSGTRDARAGVAAADELEGE